MNRSSLVNPELVEAEARLAGISPVTSAGTTSRWRKMRQEARQTLRLVDGLARSGDLWNLGFVTDYLLPYLVQYCSSVELCRTATAVAAAFCRDGDRESAGIWLQFAAISMRNAGNVIQATRLAQQAVWFTGDTAERVRSAYCLITLASCNISAGRLADARYDLQRINSELPITDENLGVHAQADLERTKLSLRGEDGDGALYFSDSATERFSTTLTFSYAQAVVQGYHSAALRLARRPGKAYLAGLRSVTSMLHNGDLPSLVNLAGPLQSLVASGVYGFPEEAELGISLSRLMHSPIKMQSDYDSALRSASKLYLFHLQYTAFPEECYENPLEILCNVAVMS